MRDVACPVLIQNDLLLVFRHPLAGVQLVKGGVEPGETPEAAAIRELSEESGLTAQTTGPATSSTDIQPGERWWFTQVTIPEAPLEWTHHCKDDGGHLFQFFWHPVEAPLQDADSRFERARAFLHLGEKTPAGGNTGTVGGAMRDSASGA